MMTASWWWRNGAERDVCGYGADAWLSQLSSRVAVCSLHHRLDWEVVAGRRLGHDICGEANKKRGLLTEAMSARDMSRNDAGVPR